MSDGSATQTALGPVGWVLANTLCGSCIVSSVGHWLPPVFSFLASASGTAWCVVMLWESDTVKAWRGRWRAQKTRHKSGGKHE